MPQIKIITQILGEIPDDIRWLKVQENDTWGEGPEHLIMKVKKAYNRDSSVLNCPH